MVALFEVSIDTPKLLGENETLDALGIDPKWFRHENSTEVVFYSTNDEWITLTYRAGKISRELEKRLNALETSDSVYKPLFVLRANTEDKIPVVLVGRHRFPGAADKTRLL